MARQSAVATKLEGRSPRPRLGAKPLPEKTRAQAKAWRLRLVTPPVLAYDVTVVHCDGDCRYELHRELKAGRCRWFAVAVIGGELHDSHHMRYRWQALALCHRWVRG